jgi:hypothetical protein
LAATLLPGAAVAPFFFFRGLRLSDMGLPAFSGESSPVIWAARFPVGGLVFCPLGASAIRCTRLRGVWEVCQSGGKTVTRQFLFRTHVSTHSEINTNIRITLS